MNEIPKDSSNSVKANFASAFKALRLEQLTTNEVATLIHAIEIAQTESNCPELHGTLLQKLEAAQKILLLQQNTFMGVT